MTLSLAGPISGLYILAPDQLLHIHPSSWRFWAGSWVGWRAVACLAIAGWLASRGLSGHCGLVGIPRFVWQLWAGWRPIVCLAIVGWLGSTVLSAGASGSERKERPWLKKYKFLIKIMTKINGLEVRERAARSIDFLLKSVRKSTVSSAGAPGSERPGAAGTEKVSISC